MNAAKILETLVRPINQIRVSVLDNQRRQAAEQIVFAQNHGTAGDVAAAKAKHSQLQAQCDKADGLCPEIRQSL